MTLDQLRYFLEAARFEHVGKAARSARISPSAISSAIGALEDELGCELFERRGKGISLNEAGKRLRRRAEALLSQVKELPAQVAGEASRLEGTYRVAASHFLAGQVLGKAWCLLREEHPALIGEVRSMGTAQIVRELLAGRIDFGLCFSPLPQPGLRIQELARGSLRVAVRKGHPLLRAASARAAFSGLNGYPAVIHKDAAGSDVCENHPAFERAGIRPRIDTYFDDDAFAVARVAGSDAWALLPDRVIESFRGRVLPLAEPAGWEAPYTIAWLFAEHRASLPALGAFQKALSRAIATRG